MARQVNGHLGTFASIEALTAKFPPSESIGCSANVGTAIPYTKAWCDGSEWALVKAPQIQALVSGAWNARMQPWATPTPAPVPAGRGVQGATVVRAFAETSGLTASAQDANITVTMTAETSTQLGTTALKLAIVNAAGAARYVDVTSATDAINFPAWKAVKRRFAVRAAFSDPSKIAQFELYAGTSGLARFFRGRKFPHSLDKCNEGRTYGFHDGASAVSDTLTDTDDVTQFRIRVYVNAGQTLDAYIDGIYLPDRVPPFLVWTIDDDDDSMQTYADILAARGMRGTFGINTLSLGSAGKMTLAQIDALAAAGHEIASHNINNTTITAAGLPTYLDEYRDTKWLLAGRGSLNGSHYHPWVQGDCTAAGAAALRAEGVRLLRGVSDANAEPLFRHQNTNEVPVRSFGSAIELAAMLTHLQDGIDYCEDIVTMAHKIEGTTYADTVTWPVAEFTTFADTVAAAVASGQLGGAGTVGDWLRYRGLF